MILRYDYKKRLYFCLVGWMADFCFVLFVCFLVGTSMDLKNKAELHVCVI